MTRLLFPLLMLVSAVAFAAPSRVLVPYTRAEIPADGYIATENVRFEIEGNFINTCYRPGFNPFEVTVDDHRIEITPIAFLYDGICWDVMIPFRNVVDLGPLPAGDYEVVQTGVPGRLGVVRVHAVPPGEAAGR